MRRVGHHEYGWVSCPGHRRRIWERKMVLLRTWTVRRMGAHERWDKEVVLEVEGSAWRQNPERGGDEVHIDL